MDVPSSLIVLFIGSIPVAILFASGFVSGTNTPTDDQVVSEFVWNDGILWELRVFTTLLVAVLAIASFFVIRKHPLTVKVMDKIAVAVKADEAAAESKETERSGVENGGNNPGSIEMADISSRTGSRSSIVSAVSNPALVERRDSVVGKQVN